jgi:DNA replication protein DnaC
MQAIKQFLDIDDVFKKVAKKIVQELADRDDFEANYQYKLTCPGCGEETASGLFYRILNQEDWFPAGETMKCSECRDQEAFRLYQKKSLQELRMSIGQRLMKEYFFLPEGLKNAGFKNFDRTNHVTAKAKENAMNYTKMFLAGERYNLLIMGNPGTGKSHLCSAIARTAKENGFMVGFLTTGHLLSMIKASFDKDDVKKGAAKAESAIFKDIKKLDLLILDDLGSESIGKSNDWRQSTIFEIVESRSGKPTIYTSNLTDIDLPVAVGNRVFSRLFDNTKFIDMFIENYDYRKNLIVN